MDDKTNVMLISNVSKRVLEIEKETRLQNNGSSNKSAAVNKILKMLDEVVENDNQWYNLF